MRLQASCFLSLSLVLCPSSLLRADGGAVCLSEQKGNYRITVFTSPTPVRAGAVDVSVLVQDAASGELASEIDVTIRVRRSEAQGAESVHAATTAAATNKLFHAANFDLPEPGGYSLAACIDGNLGKAQVHFELLAAEPLPVWSTLWPWISWPVLAIALFGVHQRLVSRRRPARWRAA